MNKYQQELLDTRIQQFMDYELSLQELDSFVKGMHFNATDTFTIVQEAAKDRYQRALDWVLSDRPANTVFHRGK